MYKDFFAYYKPYRTLFVIDFTCAVLSAVFELFFPVAVNYVIDHILPTGNLGNVLLFCGLLLLIYLISMALNYIVVALGHRLGINIESDMRRQLFAHYQKQSFAYFDRVKTGELMSRVTSDLFEISEMAHHGPEDIFITVMTLLGAFIIMLKVHVKLALITVLLIPVLLVALVFFSRKMVKVNQGINENLGHFNAGMQNALTGMKVVKAFANEDYEANRFESLIQGYRHHKLNFYQTMASSSSFNFIIMRLINLFALIAGAYYTLKGELSVGQLVGYVLISNTFVRPIERINTMLEIYPKGIAGFKRFKEEISKPADISDRPDAVPAPIFKGDITYQDVSFGYQNGKEVLSHINLNIKAGDTVALVGPSGSGKTTLVNLLPRFYELSKGRIEIDGRDIQSLTMSSLRQQIGIVQQDVFLFDGSLRENVLYGRLDASPDEVNQAIHAAKLDDLVASLPQGLDTQIGERGASLSGGQQQRLSIARIFLKNPSILILDEATSALDTATEQYIQDSFNDLAKGRTTLIIAHRLATIKKANRILVVTPEGIVEDGSHEELLAKKGRYAALYWGQFEEEAYETDYNR